MEDEIKLEKEKLNSKINDLELKIYNLNDQKNTLTKENQKLKEQLEILNQKEEIKNENHEENNNKESINENNNNENKTIENNTNENNDKENININLMESEVKLDNKELENIKNEKEELMVKYDQLLRDKSSIEEEKNRLLDEYNILKEENDKIKLSQKNLESENEKLKSDYEKLKEEFNNNEMKLKSYIDQENLNININNQNNTNDDLYLTKLTELDELKLKITKYETGEIVSEPTKQKMLKEKSEFSLKEKNYLEKMKEKDKKINEYISRIKQNESKIKLLTEKMLGINQEKGELENIVLKQESRVGKLGEKVNQIESLLKNKNEEIRENENYSLKLINIIKEQKSLINTLKKEQKTLEENYSTIEDNVNTMNSLKAQINALKKKLEVKEESFLTLQKSHKILQEKYLKTCSNNRKKEQEILLKQAKKLKADKIQREKDLFYEKNRKLLDLKKDIMEKNYSSLNNFKPKKSPSSAYKNKNEIKAINLDEKGIKDENNCDKSSIQLGPVLPIIKSSKNKERIERMKKKNEDDGKLEEISDMMNNILNEL